MHVTMTLSLPRQPSTVTRARHVLTTLLSLTDADEEVRGHLAVLISEACANAVTHSDPDSTVDLTIVIDDNDYLIRSRSADGGCPSSRHSPTAPPSLPDDPATCCYACGRTSPRCNVDRSDTEHRHTTHPAPICHRSPPRAGRGDPPPGMGISPPHAPALDLSLPAEVIPPMPSAYVGERPKHDGQRAKILITAWGAVDLWGMGDERGFPRRGAGHASGSGR